MEPETTLEMRGGAFLVLGMDLHQRRIDIQDHRPVTAGGGASSPHPVPDGGHRLAGAVNRVDVECVGEGPVQRRVRTHLTEQPALGSQRLDISARLAATGELSIAWTSTLPRSWTGVPPPVHPTAADNVSPTRSRSANDPKACNPTWPATWVPPVSTLTLRVLLAFTSEMPSCLGNRVFVSCSFPHQEGVFADPHPSTTKIP